ncbi:MAG: SLBB domain-containing protein [Bacillota bacterium]
MSWRQYASGRLAATLVVAVMAVLVVAFGPSFALPALAQADGGAEEYLLGPGDVISISVFGDDQLGVAAEIGPDGIISIPLVGSVKVSGLTVAQASRDIAHALSVYIKNPDVTVTVVEYRKVRVAVVGEVARPGIYEVPSGSGVVAAIAAAGGLTELADADCVVAMDGAVRHVDYSSVVGGSTADFPVGDGAVVHVPREVRQILVLGDVVHPGSYPAPKGSDMRLLDAVAAAGGVAGDARRAQVVWNGVRDGVQGNLSASLGALIDAPGSESNIILASGDVIFISEAPQQASVIGEVARPGVYSVGADTTLLDLLAAAGGLGEGADLGNVRVYSGGCVEDGEVFELADSDLAFTGDVKANPKIAAGAVVVVPSAYLRVQVAGYVARPGQVELERGATALEAITAAGGVREDGDGSKVALTRKSDEASEVCEIDIEGILSGRAPRSEAPGLLDGDVLFVPKALESLTLLGEVVRPGVYPVDRGSTLMDVIASAGGPTEWADMGAVRVYEGGSVGDFETLELAEGLLVFEGSLKANPQARAGQVVIIPSTAIHVTATGHVGRPGQVALSRGATVLDAVASAGGIGLEGDGTRVVLTRSDDEGVRSIEIDIEGVSEGRLGAAPVLLDGDSIYVPRQAPLEAAVLGEVARPGVYRVSEDATLLDLLAAAGGPGERADLGNVKVYSGGCVEDGEVFELAEEDLAFTGDVKANPKIAAGAVVVVPSAYLRVQVAGYVARPGQVELERGATALEAIVAAGGVREDGDGSKVALTRKLDEASEVCEIDIEGILSGRAPRSEAPGLLDGDVLFVPKALESLTLLGEVVRPGVYPVERGSTLMDVIASAGGPTEWADMGAVRVYEGGSVGDFETLELAEDLLVFEGSLKANPQARAGQVVIIPSTAIHVTATGHVGRPGRVALSRGATVLDAVASAGGIGLEGDGTRVVLTRSDDEGVRSMEIDIEGMLSGRVDRREAPGLLDGDVLFVPKALESLTLLGEVVRPGVYPVERGTTLMDVIASAGGPTEWADMGAVRVYEGGSVGDFETLELAEDLLVFEGSLKANPQARAGQVVIIPSTAIHVTATGHVGRPGQVALSRGATVLDAIASAGGIGLEGDGTRVVLTRSDDEGVLSIEIDIEGISEGRLGAAPVLLDGDSIYVPRQAPFEAAVLGEVARPGVYRVGRGSTLMDVIASAGGPTEKADLSQVKMYKGGEAAFGVSLEIADDSLIYTGDLLDNPKVDAGNVIVVPAGTIKVHVAGHVVRPGSYELKRGAGVLDAILVAGGASGTGDGSKAILTASRDGKILGIEVDVDAVFAGNAENTLLSDGDSLFVPEATAQVVVLGEVARPGAYRLAKGARLLDAIAAAGGATEKAFLENIRVFSEGVSEEPRYMSVIEGDSIGGSCNPEVFAGDVIVVPCGTVKVNVIGSVARPGNYELPQGARILDALSAAGGIASYGDGSHVVCSSAAGPVDVEALVAEPYGEANGLLSSGDVVYVPEARPQVTVLGEVARPGVYTLAREATLMEALAAAGGPSKHAALDGVRVYEGSDVEGGARLDVADEKLIYSGDVKANPRLEAGQIVVVPSGAMHVQVAGSVTRPGEVELARGATIIEAVTAAGGIRADGDGAGVVVTRQGAGTQIVDIDEAMAGREEPVALLDGDVIYVPQRSGEVVVLGEVLRPGGYSLPKGAKLLDAIAAAGGPGQKASLEDVTIYKGGIIGEGKDAPIGAGKVLFSGKVTENPEVRPGDVIHVGSRFLSVSVFGRVTRPGTLELPVGARVLDAVGAAGGILIDGDHTQISLTRSGAVGPADSIDLEKVLRDSGDGANRALSEGDLIYVPQVSRQVAVMGEVARPGVYQYVEEMTLMDVLAMAGGPTRMADLEGVRVYRGEDVENALRLSVADERLEYVGGIKANPKVRPGDIVMIPSGAIRVQVAGHVARAGEVEIRKGGTLLDAISAAGGLVSSGDGTRVVLTRAGADTLEVDVDSLLAGDGDRAPGVQTGDVIFVPEANRKVAVMGSVLRPGLYDFKPGMRLIDALALAGGATATANLSKVMVYSGDEAAEIALGGSPSSKGVYMDPTKGNNPELGFGDIVIVPPAQTVNWSQISAMLTIMNQLMNIIMR